MSNSAVWLVEKQCHSSYFDEVNLNNGDDGSRNASKDEKIQKTQPTPLPSSILLHQPSFNTTATNSIKCNKSNTGEKELRTYKDFQ